MSYPVTSEERLIKLYGLTVFDVHRIFKECGEDKTKYQIKLEELDDALSASVYTQITSDKFIVH